MNSVLNSEQHGSAEFAGYSANHALECVDVFKHPEVLESGWWAVVGDSAGGVRAWRFKNVARRAAHSPVAASAPRGWVGIDPSRWSTSMDEADFRVGVKKIKALIAAGELEQCNLTRVISAPLGFSEGPTGCTEPQARSLYEVLRRETPAPYLSYIHIPDVSGVAPIWLVSASPELFLERRERSLKGKPIKGTAAKSEELLPKDEWESRLIAHQFAREMTEVCEPETVEVSSSAVEEFPDLVHLVREVTGDIRETRESEFWRNVFENLAPPLSVAGVPRSAATEAIQMLEPERRGPYCGFFGWINGDNKTAQLAVTIRSFWWEAGRLFYGTGAGITAESDPEKEWLETELKARRLLALISGKGSAQ